MSHYHMARGLITAHHSDDKSCGGGSHTRYDEYDGESAWVVTLGMMAQHLGHSDGERRAAAIVGRWNRYQMVAAR